MTKRALFLFIAVISLCIATPTLLSSCGGVDCKDPANASSASCVATNVVEDCTASDLSSAITKYGPPIANAIATQDFSALESLVAQAGFCVVSEIFSKYLLGGNATVAAGSGSGSAGSAGPSKADIAAEYEKLRAEHAPGKKVKTSRGVL